MDIVCHPSTHRQWLELFSSPASDFGVSSSVEGWPWARHKTFKRCHPRLRPGKGIGKGVEFFNGFNAMCYSIRSQFVGQYMNMNPTKQSSRKERWNIWLPPPLNLTPLIINPRKGEICKERLSDPLMNMYINSFKYVLVFVFPIKITEARGMHLDLLPRMSHLPRGQK